MSRAPNGLPVAHCLTFKEVVVLVVAGAHGAAEELRGGSGGGDDGGTRGRRCRGNPSVELQLPDSVKSPALPASLPEGPSPSPKVLPEKWRPAHELGRVKCAGVDSTFSPSLGSLAGINNLKMVPGAFGLSFTQPFRETKCGSLSVWRPVGGGVLSALAFRRHGCLRVGSMV